MANYERPDNDALEGIVVPEGIEASLSSDLYSEVTTRLWDLGIVPVKPPKLPDVFMRPIDRERTLALVAFGQEVVDASGEPILTQRLIANTRIDDGGKLPIIVVDDFILDHSDETISYQQSVIPTRRELADEQLIVDARSGPYINLHSMNLVVTSGSLYERNHFETAGFEPNNLSAENVLLGALRILDAIYREPVLEYHLRVR